MKARLTYYYDPQDSDDTTRLLRMQHADDAWSALWGVLEVIRTHNKGWKDPPLTADELADKIAEIVHETDIHKYWY
jgi:hypothetical protein